jgi:hypothetical protein
MSKITAEDYAKIQEPCKTCPSGLEAFGRGKEKKIRCKATHSKLMGEGSPYWFPIKDCPRQFPRDRR